VAIGDRVGQRCAKGVTSFIDGSFYYFQEPTMNNAVIRSLNKLDGMFGMFGNIWENFETFMWYIGDWQKLQNLFSADKLLE